jgi:tetratricopeptide (TPR) repeat protein
LAYSYEKLGKNKQSINFYEAYLRDKGKNSAVYNNLGLLFEGGGKLARAEELIRLAIEADPTNDKAPNNLHRIQKKIK